MKIEKHLAKLGRLIGLGEDADKEQIRKLHKVLKALKSDQHKLEKKLETAEGEHSRRKIQQRLDVIAVQREKGVRLYKRLKAGLSSTSAEP